MSSDRPESCFAAASFRELAPRFAAAPADLRSARGAAGCPGMITAGAQLLAHQQQAGNPLLSISTGGTRGVTGVSGRAAPRAAQGETGRGCRSVPAAEPPAADTSGPAPPSAPAAGRTGRAHKQRPPAATGRHGRHCSRCHSLSACHTRISQARTARRHSSDNTWLAAGSA